MSTGPIPEIDRDAKTDRLVTVMSTGSAYARSAETKYRTDDGTMQTGKVKTDSVVHVQDRAISALSLAERLQLAEHRGTPIPGAQALTGGQLDDNVGAKVLCRQGPELVEGILRSEVKRGGHGFSARSVTQYTLEQPDQRQGMTIRPGINEVVRVDGDIAQTRAALDLTGGHPASRMASASPSIGSTSTPARAVSETPTPPGDGPAIRPTSHRLR